MHLKICAQHPDGDAAILSRRFQHAGLAHPTPCIAEFMLCLRVLGCARLARERLRLQTLSHTYASTKYAPEYGPSAVQPAAF